MLFAAMTVQFFSLIISFDWPCAAAASCEAMAKINCELGNAEMGVFFFQTICENNPKGPILFCFLAYG